MTRQNRAKRRQSAHRLRFNAAVLAVILVSGLLLAGTLRYLRGAALNDGERATNSIARLVSEQTTRSIQTVAQALELSRSRLAALEAGGMLDEDSARALLREEVARLPYLRAIWVMDASGKIKFDSDVGNIGVSLADRDYFRVYLERPGTGFFLGRPVRSRSIGTWLIGAAFPTWRKSGQFDGVIAAAIEPPYFDQLWSSLGLGSGGSVALFRQDGVLLARSPYVESAIGQSFLGRAEFFARLPQDSMGTLRGASAIDAQERVVSYRQLAEHPELVIVVGQSYDTLLAPWRRAALLASTIWFAAMVITALLCKFWLTERERRRRSEERSVQSQKMEAMGTLASGIAHDFNNIVAGILGNVTLARSELGADQRAKPMLDEIQKATLRGRALVQQILTFSRDQPIEMEVVALQPLFEETMALLRATLPGGVQLVKRFPDTPLCVRGDATRLQQVLMNLGTNAWRALNGAGGRVEIALESVSFGTATTSTLGRLNPGDYADLSVSDTGQGISSVVQQRMFEPFFTTRAKEGGTGLGLAVVHGIVVAHGGAITVQSAVGEGTTFHVYLPLTAEPAALVVAPPPSHKPVAACQRVLYVDDDEVILLMVQGLLHRHGLHVAAFRDARDALAAVAARPEEFDLVVTDHDMPGMSGLDLAKEVNRIRPDLPILLSSGLVSDELRSDARAAGVSEVLCKEDSYRDLGETVLRLLAEAQESQRQPRSQQRPAPS